MFKAIQKIFSSFSSKGKPKYSEKKNFLVFSIAEEGDIHIEYMLQNNTDDAAKHLSDFLFELNGGQCTGNLVNLLLKLAKDNNNYAEFVKKTIAYWSIRITNHVDSNNNISDEKPIITPSKFYFGDAK